MENKKDIGKAFKEKLSHLEKTPNESVWSSIDAELQQQKKRRIAYIPFWMKTAGIISLGLLVSFFVFINSSENNYFFTPNESNRIDSKTNTTGTEKKEIKKDDYKNSPNRKSNIDIEDSGSIKKTGIVNHNVTETVLSTKSNKTGQNSFKNKRKHSLAEKNKRYYLFAKENKSRNNNKKRTSKNNQKKSNNKKTILLNENLSPIVTGNNELVAVIGDTIFDDSLNIKKTDSLKIEIKKEKKLELKKRLEEKVDSTTIDHRTFDVFAYASPTYYDFISNKSSIDNRLDSNSKTSKIKFSYGIYLCYEMNKKWSSRFGISKINLNYQTENVPINTSNYSNISYSQNVSNASIYSQSNNSETMNVIQKISYTEIPLEIKYTFYNKKLGIGAITGLSYLFLNENSVVVKPQNGGTMEIGKTRNLSDYTFSANLGASFHYQFSEKLKLNVEPMIKYHLKDYENAGANLKPYTFGVQTGLQYSFFKIKKKVSEKSKKKN